MAISDKKLRQVYSTLQKGGYGEDYDTFMRGFAGNENYQNRKTVYDLLKGAGADIGDTYEDFIGNLQSGNKGSGNYVYNPDGISPVEEKKEEVQPVINVENTEEEGVDDATFADYMRGIQAGMKKTQAAIDRTNKAVEYGKKNLGPNVKPVGLDIADNRNVMEEEVYNPETMQMEKKYTTSYGGTYKDKFSAKQEQDRIDLKNRFDSLQRDIEKERQIVYAEVDAEIDKLQKQIATLNAMKKDGEPKQVEGYRQQAITDLENKIADLQEKRGEFDKEAEFRANKFLYENSGMKEQVEEAMQQANETLYEMNEDDKVRQAIGAVQRNSPNLVLRGAAAGAEELYDLVKRWSNPEYGKAVATQRKLSDASKDTELALGKDDNTWMTHLLRGAWDGATDIRTWDFGINDMTDMGRLYQLQAKADRIAQKELAGEESEEKLTASEQKMLDAIALSNTLEANFSEHVPMSYRVGKSVPESAGFAAAIAMNPASGLGKSIGKQAARRLIANGMTTMRYGKWGVKALSAGARVGGDALEALSTTLTTALPRTVEGVFEDMAGTAQGGYDERGNLVFDKVTDMERNTMKAVGKSLYTNWMENQSEMVGEYFQPIGNFIRQATKNRVWMRNAVDVILGSDDAAKKSLIGKFRDRAKINGVFGEYTEEVYNNVMNAVPWGDMNMTGGVMRPNRADYKTEEEYEKAMDEWRGSVFNAETNVETFLSVTAMIFPMGAAELGGRYLNAYTTKAQLDVAIDNLNKTIGQEQASAIMNEMRNAESLQDMSKIYLTAMQDGRIKDGKPARALLDAVGRLVAYQSVNTSQANSTITEDKFERDYRNAYDAGHEMPVENKHKAGLEYESSMQELDRVLGDSFQSIASMPFEQFRRLMQTLTPEQRSVAQEYYLQSARLAGMRDASMEEADKQVQMHYNTLRRVADKNGIVYRGSSLEEGEFISPESMRIPGSRMLVVLNADNPGASRVIAREEAGEISTSEMNEELRTMQEGLRLKAQNDYLWSVMHNPSTKMPQVGETIEYDEDGSGNGKRMRVIGFNEQGQVQLLPTYIDGETMEEKVSSGEPIVMSQYEALKRQDSYYDTLEAEQSATETEGQTVITPVTEGLNDSNIETLSQNETAPETDATILTDEQGRVIDNWLNAEDDTNLVHARIDSVGDDVWSQDTKKAMHQYVDSVRRQQEQTTDSQQEQTTELPRDEKGNVLYHKAPIETTVADLMDGSLEDDEIDAFIDANIESAQKEVDKRTKDKPVMTTNKEKYLQEKAKWKGNLTEAEGILAYWNTVKDAIEEKRNSVTETETEPMTEQTDGVTESVTGQTDGVTESVTEPTEDMTEGMTESTQEQTEGMTESTQEQTEGMTETDNGNRKNPTKNKKRKKVKYDIYEFTGKDVKNKKGEIMRNPHPELTGVYHDDGYAIASDSRILVADKRAYDESKQGKVIGKDGTVIPEKYPDWRYAIPVQIRECNMDPYDMLDFLSDVKKKAREMKLKLSQCYVYFTVEGHVMCFGAENLDKFCRASIDLNASSINFTNTKDDNHILLFSSSENGFTLAGNAILNPDDFKKPENFFNYEKPISLGKEVNNEVRASLRADGEENSENALEMQPEIVEPIDDTDAEVEITPIDDTDAEVEITPIDDTDAEEETQDIFDQAEMLREREKAEKLLGKEIARINRMAKNARWVDSYRKDGTLSRKQIRAMENLASKLGLKIEWHDTMSENGLYDPKTRTIHIALDAQNPIDSVFGHETMHKIAENEEDYEMMRNLAIEILGEEEFNRRADGAEELYKENGYDYERAYYEQEVVCDFMGDMLHNDGLLERVSWNSNHRVLSAIRDVLDKIISGLGLVDENLVRVRTVVSAAYNNAIRRAEESNEDVTVEEERKASHRRKEEVDAKSRAYFEANKTGLTEQEYAEGQAMMDRMASLMNPYIDATAKGRRILPEERYGGKDAASTIFSNGSYGKSMENTLICLRTLAYNEFVNAVKRELGRPITQRESFLASQMVYDIATDPQCLYCYVSLDRKAYDEFLLRYMTQRDEVLTKFRALSEEEKNIGKKNPNEALAELYKEYLNGRKDTKEQKNRFNMWIRNEIAGIKTITTADLATSEDRENILNGLDDALAAQVKDAEKYAKSAAWAKKEVDYISYVGELLKLSKNWVNKLTSEYGLRFYSFSEYTPAFLLENMQMVRDAALRGLRGLGYTKEIDFVKVFAPTGMNINCSCYGRLDKDGNMQMDTLQGADWNEVKDLRNKYKNVGAVFVATNDAAVEWALAQDWIDVVIPFHIVRTGQDIADFYGWTNFSSEQADKAKQGQRKMYISPVEHKNDKETFLAACEKHNVTPRFAKWLDNPNYMKLVNETRLSVDESVPLRPVFDMEAAEDSWTRFVNKGGYYNGWWQVDEEGLLKAIQRVVEDIKAGKKANEVEYGNQKMPVNVDKMAREARKKRMHGQAPVMDVFDKYGNVIPAQEIRASVRKGTNVPEMTDEEQALRYEGDSGIRFSIRTEPDPKRTIKVYKLMRLGEDGKLYPLFIGNTEEIVPGTWYNADSPVLKDLKSLPADTYNSTYTATVDGEKVKKEYTYGSYLVNNETGEAIPISQFIEDRKKEGDERFSKMKGIPNADAIRWATENGYRWIKVEDNGNKQTRYGGDTKSFYNYGINGAGSVGKFAMRPGWHAGSLPTMRQIGKGSKKNLRDDNFVWVEGEIPADIDYNEEASKNPDRDIPDRIPKDGYYMKATNADKTKSQAGAVGWYVAGAFKANRVISDDEARSVIDKFNMEHEGQLNDKVEYDYEREGGIPFREEDAKKVNERIGANMPELTDDIFSQAEEIRDNEQARASLRNNSRGVGLTYTAMQRAWDREMSKASFFAKEGYWDYLASVDEFQKLIARETGREISSMEDTYRAMLSLSSKNANDMKQFDSLLALPLQKAILKLIGATKNYDRGPGRELCDYLMAKHGIERNRDMSVRNALKEKNTDENGLDRAAYGNDLDTYYASVDKVLIDAEQNGYSWRMTEELLDQTAESYGADLSVDYSGLQGMYTDDGADKYVDYQTAKQSAIRDVEYYEALKDKDDLERLWDAVRAISSYSLVKQSQSGLTNEEYLRDQMRRYRYFVPLRGFAEDTAEEMYDYIDADRTNGGLGSPVKTAKGHQHKSGDPIGNLLNVAYRSIASGNKNMAISHLYNLATTRDTGGILKVSKIWLENKGTKDDPDWVMVAPNLTDPSTGGPEMSGEDVQDELDRFEKEMQQKKEQGLVMQVTDTSVTPPYRIETKQHNQSHQIRVNVAGRPRVITVVGNPRLAMAMNGLLNPETSAWKGLSVLNNFLSAAFTSVNPSFGAANLVRDSLHSNMRMFVSESPIYWAKYTAKQKMLVGNAANWAQMLTMLRDYQKGRRPSGQRAQAFKEFMDGGGATGYTMIRNQEESIQFVKDMMKELKKGKTSKVNPMRLFDLFSYANEAAELVNRFLAYETSREMGRTIERSINDAKEATLNFNRKGAGTRSLTDKRGVAYTLANALNYYSQYGRSFLIFFNAFAQGQRQLWEMAKANPGKFTLAFGVVPAVTAGIALPMLNNVLLPAIYGMASGAGDDDDYVDYYDDLSDWERHHNLCIRAGKSWIKIPLSPELSSMYALGDVIGGAAWGKREMSGSDLMVLADLLVPNNVDTSQPKVTAAAYAPSAVRPLVNVGINMDFMGRPISKESSYNKYSPAWRKATRSTSQSLTALSRALNAASGGSDERQGVLDVNPGYVQEIMTGLAGGYMSTTLAVSDALLPVHLAGGGTEQSFADGAKALWDRGGVPIISRFYVPGSGERKTSRAKSQYNETVVPMMQRVQSEFSQIRGITREAKQDMVRADARLKDAQASGDTIAIAEALQGKERAEQALREAAQEQETKTKELMSSGRWRAYTEMLGLTRYVDEMLKVYGQGELPDNVNDAMRSAVEIAKDLDKDD